MLENLHITFQLRNFCSLYLCISFLFQDKETIKRIAKDYCERLMTDVNTVEKMKSKLGRSGHKYEFFRHENLLLNSASVIMEVFNYLEVCLQMHYIS